MSAQDLPLAVRAERVPLELTRQTVELCCAALAPQLAELEASIATGDRLGFAQMPGMVAERIALIDALAELRGER